MKHFQLFISSCFILFSISLTAQEALYTEIDAKYNFDPHPEDRWSYVFSSRYRSSFYDSGKFDYDTSFLELNAAPTFSINSNHAVSLVLRYRIKKLFDNKRTDEKRLIQQYAHSYDLNKVKLKGRLRVEQRFRGDFNLRNRYRIGITFDLNKSQDKLKKWSLTTDTEFLWSISSKKHPVFDQRFSLSLEKPISNTFTFKLKPEYRYLDYTHQRESALRIYIILKITV
ncbi:MAG TPA: DUF2490 domain-containing protein [Flavobacteriaceae bacterium]|nr:DUF2490 domain-containing protein [Flavobacteriaceae bacterium]